MMQISRLAPVLNAEWIGGDGSFDSVSTDTRSLKEGDLFVALRGERFDGHSFAAEAVARGACALLVDQYQADLAVPQLLVANTTKALGQMAAYRRKIFRGRLIGITGSSGKTSVKGMLRDILAKAGTVVATQGNLNNQIGVPLSLLRLDDQDYAVIEMGTNKPGEIAYLSDLVRPDIALVNNVMPAHIGGFGSLAAIAEEKSAIYNFLRGNQTAVINLDDRFADAFIAQTRRSYQIGFSVLDDAQQMPAMRATDVRWSALGCATFVLHYNREQIAVTLVVPGRHNLNNALAAAACALAAGCNLIQIAAGLAQFRGEPGRMQVLDGPGASLLINDTYNANPGSVAAAIDFLGERNGRKILVLGDLGELGYDAPEFHRQLGRYARQRQLSAVYTCGALSRLCAEAFGDGSWSFDDHESLAEALRPHLSADVTVLVKGSRSARMERVVHLLCQEGDKHPC